VLLEELQGKKRSKAMDLFNFCLATSGEEEKFIVTIFLFDSPRLLVALLSSVNCTGGNFFPT
jgi:hypothetical protein